MKQRIGVEISRQFAARRMGVKEGLGRVRRAE